MKLLAFAEEFLDLLSTPLGPVIGQPTLPHAHPHMKAAAPSRVGSDMRLNLAPKHLSDELLMEESFVRPQALGSETQSPFGPVEQAQRPLFLRGTAAEDLHPNSQQDAIAILHQRVDGIPG